MDRGAWWATVQRVTKSRTQLKQLSVHTRVFLAVSGAFSSGSAQALVTALPLVAEHGLLGTQAGLSRCLSGLRSTGSVAAAHGLSCPTACGISAGQGWNPRLLR